MKSEENEWTEVKDINRVNLKAIFIICNLYIDLQLSIVSNHQWRIKKAYSKGVSARV
jgi:hypothetical protein